VTDHKPSIWLESVKDPTSRLVRWRLKLAEYEYKICYKAEKINLNVDALSRNQVVAPAVEDVVIKTDSCKTLFPLTQDKTPAKSDLPSDTIPASTTHTKNNSSQQR